MMWVGTRPALQMSVVAGFIPALIRHCEAGFSQPKQSRCVHRAGTRPAPTTLNRKTNNYVVAGFIPAWRGVVSLRGVKEGPIYQDSRLEIEEIPNLKHQIPSIQPSAFIFLVCSEVDGWLLTTDY